MIFGSEGGIVPIDDSAHTRNAALWLPATVIVLAFLADAVQLVALPSPARAVASPAGAIQQARAQTADASQNIGQDPFESTRTVYIHISQTRPRAFAFGWPGAESGVSPRLEGPGALYEYERCEVQIALQGAADSAYLGLGVESLVPVARVADDSIVRRAKVAFALEDCPTESPVRVRPENLNLLRLRPVLVDVVRDSVERLLGREDPLAPGVPVQVWEYPEGARLAVLSLALKPTAGSQVGELMLAFLRLSADGPPKIVHLIFSGREAWWPVALVDVDGQGRPEFVVMAPDHRSDPSTLRVAVLRETDDGGWSLWRLISLFRAYPYND